MGGANPSAMVQVPSRVAGPALVEAPAHGGRSLRLDPEDAHAPTPRQSSLRGQRPCNPRDLATAPDRNHDHRLARDVLAHLEPGRTVARDHGCRVEGMQKDEPLLVRAPPCLAEGFRGVPVQMHLGPVSDGRLHLRPRDPFGHHDDGARTRPPRRPGHRLRVVPGPRS